jgi:MFS family permease
MENAAGKMSFGQMSEIFFMLVLPFFLVRLGVKWTLAVGMLAWTVRYVFFAFGDTGSLVSLLYLGILLHGVCYDFFFVTGFIYTDKKAPPEIRASAQGLLALLTYGVGMLIGSLISGPIVDAFKQGEALHNWRNIWLVPGTMALVVLIFFVLTFKDRSVDSKTQEA